MAVKKTQMYRKNLDTSETNLYPLTEAQYVSMENGQTVQEILSDRDSDKYTPVITNSSSTFKVGQGDNVDLSSSMKEGAYDSCVLKGKTMVNCIQEPSSKDVVLPYEFADGQYVTINDTKESGALGVELKGQTLVNIHKLTTPSLAAHATGWYENLVTNSGEIGFDVLTSPEGWRYINAGKLNYQMLKPNTKYLVVFESSQNISSIHFMRGDGLNGLAPSTVPVQNSKAIITTNSQIVANEQILYVNFRAEPNTKVSFKNPMIIEYVEGMENWDIPYIEGMTSCKMPTLHTVGKNLFDLSNASNGYLSTNAPYVLQSPDYNNKTSAYIKVKPNTKYSYSFDGFTPSQVGNMYWTGFYYYKRIGEVSTVHPSRMTFTSNSEANKQLTFTTPSDCNYIRIGSRGLMLSGATVQLEEATSATAYEPYKSSILSLPEEVVLRSLPNGVRDTFNTRTGVYTQRIGELVFDGSDDEDWRLLTASSNWVNFSPSVCTFVFPKPSNCALTWGRGGNENSYLTNKFPAVPSTDPHAKEDKEKLMFDSTNIKMAILKTSLKTEDVEGLRIWLSQNPIVTQYELETPIVTKISLPSTLKSWNTTTHIHSEIPENTLYPILSHSNPTYPVILKPSTKYSIIANSYSNSHTNSPINFNLGGATATTTVGNRVTTVTTPATLGNELLTMSGRGNKLNNVMVIEGDVMGDEPYFEGICDCKSPILSNVGKNLFNIDGKFVKGAYSYGIPTLNNSNQVIEKIGENSLHITCGTNYYHSGWGQIIDVKNLDSVTISVTSAFSSSLTTPELKVLCLYESEEVPVTMDGQKKTDYDNRHLTQVLNDTNKTYTRTIDTRGFAKVYVLFTGGYKAEGQGTFDFTLHNIYVGEESTHHDYEPYKSNTTTFDQKDDKTIVLRSLPNGVCDTLNVETGEYVQRIGEVTKNNSTGFRLSGGGWENKSDVCTFEHFKPEGMKVQLANNKPTLNCDKVPSNTFTTQWKNSKGIESITQHSGGGIVLSITRDKLLTQDVDGLNTYLQSNPLTIQYELATPIVSTIDIQGFPYAYTNGHVQLSSGHSGQSLTPKVEYSLSANKTGQIDSNTRQVVRQQKQLDDFEAMMLTSLVQSAYDKAILQFDYEMQMMSLGGE